MQTITTLSRAWALLAGALLLAACSGASAPVTTAAASASPSSTATSVALTGTPAASVAAGQNYLFQPTLTQGSGVVTFAIQGQPKWATFDANTGVMTGTPGTADEGRTASITISASNGSSSAAIGPFTIMVNAPAAPSTGTASLTWNAPTQNTDGTPLTDLAGYHIYYGTNASALTSSVTVANAAQTSYVVTGLAPGTYYFSIVAYNASGMDSADSNTASKTI